MRYACPCCSYYTFEEKPSGTYYICPVCYWEDDIVQLEDPDFSGGANEVSLNKAKENFKKFVFSSRCKELWCNLCRSQK